jgi:hypothetical protein
LLTRRTAAADADAIIKDKFAPALDASILRLQNVMEGLCFDLKRSEGKRDAKAGKQTGYACSLSLVYGRVAAKLAALRASQSSCAAQRTAPAYERC